MKNSEPTHSVRLLTAKEVMYRLGIKRTSLFVKTKTGAIPAPISLGNRSLRWRSDVIDTWITSLQGGCRND